MCKYIFTLFFIPFSFALRADACDTLFYGGKLKSHAVSSLSVLSIDSSYDSGYFHDSITAVFHSLRKDLTDDQVLAIKWKKGWKYWKVSIDVEFGEVQFSHADITGDGEPELFLWVFDYFSHHSAMESDERKNYSVLVFDVAHSRELLDFTFRGYNSDLIMDLDGSTDSLGNPWPPDEDEYFPLYFYKEKLFVFDSSKVHSPVFLNQASADSASKVSYFGVYSIDRCSDHSGIYLLKNNNWIRTTDNTLPPGKPIYPPSYFTWWEIPNWNYAPKDSSVH